MQKGCFMRRGEVLEKLGISKTVLSEMVAGKVIKRKQLVPNGQWYYYRSEVEALANGAGKINH